MEITLLIIGGILLLTSLAHVSFFGFAEVSNSELLDEPHEAYVKALHQQENKEGGEETSRVAFSFAGSTLTGEVRSVSGKRMTIIPDGDRGNDVVYRKVHEVNPI